MDKRILKALSELSEADAIMYAADIAYIPTLSPDSCDEEISERAMNAFYAVWKKVKEAQNILDGLTKGLNFEENVD